VGDPTPGHQDESGRALEFAYAHLNRRERTEAELRRHLDARGIRAAAVEVAIDTLREQGYLDDARYARLFAQDKRDLEQWGSERIRRTLLQRGVDRELVESTLGQAPPEDELERARAILRRRFPAAALDRRDRERALGVLLRKGFDSELALDALAGHSRDALP
jgi:regulatory protein